MRGRIECEDCGWSACLNSQLGRLISACTLKCPNLQWNVFCANSKKFRNSPGGIRANSRITWQRTSAAVRIRVLKKVSGALEASENIVKT